MLVAIAVAKSFHLVQQIAALAARSQRRDTI